MQFIILTQICNFKNFILGYSTEDETMIMFGELFQLYTRISNKVIFYLRHVKIVI